MGQNTSNSVQKPCEDLQKTFDLCHCQQRVYNEVLRLNFIDQILIFHHNLQINSLKILQCDFLDFFSYFVSHSWGIPVMKMTGLSHLFKWENLHNWWLTKYFFAPLCVCVCVCVCVYIYIYTHNPNDGTVGTFFFIWINLKTFKSHEPMFYSQLNREHQCLNWEMLTHYPLNELISNLKPATGLKKVGKGATKACKCKTFWKDLAGRTSSNWLS